VTNETREREGLFRADTEAAESAGSERHRAEATEMSDRAPVGTATATGATADLSATDRTERADHAGQDTPATDRNAERAEREGDEAALPSDGPDTTRTPNCDERQALGADPEDAPGGDSAAEPTDGRLAERLRAVERAITGTDDAVVDLGDEAAAAAERDALSERLDDLESRVTELEAATQAIRGYVGSIRSVNQAVERRADLALAEARKGGEDAVDGRAADRETERHDARTRSTTIGGEASDGTVPDEDALDAALPADRSGEGESGVPAASTPATGNADDTGDEATDDSWRPAALERLRESF